jgi:hypothetical protein
MNGRNWDMQVENESGDMMISIVYCLIEKNCKIALLTAKNMRVVEYNSVAWLIAVDKYVLSGTATEGYSIQLDNSSK